MKNNTIQIQDIFINNTVLCAIATYRHLLGRHQAPQTTVHDFLNESEKWRISRNHS